MSGVMLQDDGIVGPVEFDEHLSRASFAEVFVQRIDLFNRHGGEKTDILRIFGRFDDGIVLSQKRHRLREMIVPDVQIASSRRNARNLSGESDRFGCYGSVRLDEAANPELDSPEETDDQNATIRQAAALKRSENGSSGRSGRLPCVRREFDRVRESYAIRVADMRRIPVAFACFGHDDFDVRAISDASDDAEKARSLDDFPIFDIFKRFEENRAHFHASHRRL